MSKVAKVPVSVPTGVEFKIDGNCVSVTGPKGTHSLEIHPHVNVSLESNSDGNVVTFKPRDGSKAAKALSGTMRSLVNNSGIGVHTGFEKQL